MNVTTTASGPKYLAIFAAAALALVVAGYFGLRIFNTALSETCTTLRG